MPKDKCEKCGCTSKNPCKGGCVLIEKKCSRCERRALEEEMLDLRYQKGDPDFIRKG